MKMAASASVAAISDLEQPGHYIGLTVALLPQMEHRNWRDDIASALYPLKIHEVTRTYPQDCGGEQRKNELPSQVERPRRVQAPRPCPKSCGARISGFEAPGISPASPPRKSPGDKVSTASWLAQRDADCVSPSHRRP
jgi:hypothetical protein